MTAPGALLLVLGLPQAFCAAPACAAGAVHCDSQLIQTRVQPEEAPRTCLWTAGAHQVADGSSRASECERDCVEQDKVCPFAEGRFCSCAEDFFPPRGEGELAASVALENSSRARPVRRSSERRQVSFFGQRVVAPDECLSKFTNSSTYTVMIVFAGRKATMQVLLRYVDKMVHQCSVHEVHLWDYARDKLDHYWMKGIGKRRNGTEVQVMTHGLDGHGWADVYEFYSSEKLGFERPRWSPRSELATRGNTVLVKADDDIVYIDTSRFDSYVEYIRTHREKFIVHANIVNNAVAAYYQANHIEELKKQIPELGEYPREGGNGHLGLFGPLLTGGGPSLHKYFLRHREDFSWSEGDGCIAYGKEDAARHGQVGQGRFSINFFGARWAEWDNVHRLSLDPDGDEIGITTHGSAEGRDQCIFTALNVCHFGFMKQDMPRDIYTAYERLLAQSGA
mmetsp:Transcript_42586/g.118597  ORF Transcript_42586/g.118597 Transcript_42586/m.118597 type:complete len:451 (+) Transcript_42586:48-1400(+)